MEEKKPKTRRVKNYVNNRDLITEIKLSKENNKLTDKLTKMIILLVDKYASSSRFYVTTHFKDDMKNFAIQTMVEKWSKFDCDRENPNPFSYYTSIIKNAFYQYQNAEKKEKDIKNDLLIELNKSPSYSYMVAHEEAMRTEHDSYEGTNIEGDVIEINYVEESEDEE
jgi:hypothetical protein